MAFDRDDLGVWLINLPSAHERRRKMQKQLSALRISYTLFAGIDGNAESERLLKTVDKQAFERNMGRKILMGGIGCYHSHLAVWQKFLETQKPFALIMEDDVVFHDDFLSAIELGLSGSEHWDFLKLNRIRAKLPVSQGNIGSYKLNAYIGSATGTGAYLIKRETAKLLLSRMLPVTRATDHEINRFFHHNFRLRGLEPFPSHVDDGNVSLITGTDFGDVVKFPKYKRLPHYRLKAGNYFRRIAHLAKHRELNPKKDLNLVGLSGGQSNNHM